MSANISFSPALMPKVLVGTKTQTRRLVKLPREFADCDLSRAWVDPGFGDGAYLKVPRASDDTSHRVFCPKGSVGDRLWVKERLERDPLERVVYAADERLALRDDADVRWPWKPRVLGATYCPRWASRCSIDLLEVRVQRLQEISEEDAIAEGISRIPFRPDDGFPLCSGYTGFRDDGKSVLWPTAREAFAELWDSINDKPGTTWADSPWVFALTFKRVAETARAA